MKKQMILAILLYFFSILALIVSIYALFNEQIELIIASLLGVVLFSLLGYILNSYIIRQKFQIDDNVLHHTKEILHELAIPISTIQANSLLLKRTLKDDEKSLKRLSRIEDSSKRLERLYTELLYSIKKEIHVVEKESFDLLKLVQDRVGILTRLKRNSFILNLTTYEIFVDKIGFEKMLENLLVNAMKYSSKERPILITLKENLLTIEDKGVGMDEQELKTVYKRYYQSDANAYGEGIGLALVKAYCDDEKIQIKISSTKGVGTVVSLDLGSVHHQTF